MFKFLPAVKKKTSQVLLLTFLWVVLPLLSVEILMIVLEPYIFKGFLQYDPDIGFRVRPYVNGSNQFGFNDRDYSLEKAPGMTRVLILGDSFGWVGGLYENYTTFLDNKLTQRFGENQIEVINAGFPMTHTGEQLKILEKYGLQYQPDLVVLGFFTGNDFYDAQSDRKRIVLNDIYFDINPNQELKLFGYPIVPKSRLLLLIQQKYKVFQEQMKADASVAIAQTPPASPIQPPPAATPPPEPTSNPDSYPPSFSEETYLEIEAEMLKFYNIKDYESGKYRDRIQLIFDSIAAMKKLLAANHCKLIVAIYPAAFQVDDELARDIFTQKNLNPADFDLFLAQKILKQYLDREGIPYIDLLDDFRQEQKKQPLYILRNTHWNKAGNQYAADLLFNSLVPVLENEAIAKP